MEASRRAARFDFPRTGNFYDVTSGALHLLAVRRDALASFGTVEAAKEETVDLEAVKLTNASIASAALGLGIYIDTFV